MRPCCAIWRPASVLAWTTSLFFAVPAAAHPHVWIDAQIELTIEDGAVREMAVTWLFDEIFSFALIEDFDTNYDNGFDAVETGQLRANAFDGAAEGGFFTHLRSGDVTLPDPQDFSAWIENERVGYRFTLPFSEARDTQRSPFAVSVYDETFFIDVALDEIEPVVLNGPDAGKCHYEVANDTANPIYFDLVIPKRVDVHCRD